MEIRNYLGESIDPGRKYAIMGVGSVLRSDDGAGMYLIDLLHELAGKENLLLIGGSTAPENFTGVIKDFAPDTLIIVDAAHLGLLPGEVRIVPSCDISGVSFSTHMLPLSVMLRYLESETGCDVVFFGIQPACTEQGFEMGDAVKAGTRRLAEAICEIFRS